MRLSKVAAKVGDIVTGKTGVGSIGTAKAPTLTPPAPDNTTAGGMKLLKQPPPESKIVTACDHAYEQGFMDKLSQYGMDSSILEALIKLQTRAEEGPVATVGHGAARGLTVGAVLGAVLGALGGGLRGATQPEDRVNTALAGAGLGAVSGGILGAASGVPAGILARFAAK